MSKLNKTEKEYAINRVACVLRDKYGYTNLPSPKLNSVAVFMSLGLSKKNATIIAEDDNYYLRHALKESICTSTKVFKAHEKECVRVTEVNKKGNTKANTTITPKLQEAKDFIMLGDSEEVIKYLSALEKKLGV